MYNYTYMYVHAYILMYTCAQSNAPSSTRPSLRPSPSSESSTLTTVSSLDFIGFTHPKDEFPRSHILAKAIFCNMAVDTC